jgi:hypothetical protein
MKWLFAYILPLICLIALCLMIGCSAPQTVKEKEQTLYDELPSYVSGLRMADADGDWWTFKWKGHYYLYKKGKVPEGGYGPVMLEIEEHQYWGRDN